MQPTDSAVVLSVGDELVLGQTVDTNGAWLSARLAAHGVPTCYHKTVPDEEGAVAAAIREAAGQAGLVLVTGGLGPTADDVTREALARAAGAPLEEDAAAVARIEAFFRSLGRAMPERNRCQAMCPRGGRLLDNPHGTAPGVHLRLDACEVMLMPGVPFEMKPMFEAFVAPRLKARGGTAILTDTVNTFGLGESDVAQRLGELMARGRNPQVGTTVSRGIVSVRIRSTAATQAAAAKALAETSEEVQQRVGDACFGTGETTLAEVTVNALAQRGLTLATAESCTGGLIGAMITDVPGASTVYRGGWVVYANMLKTSLLGVADTMLETEGAVSEPVARRLAERALMLSGADYAMAVTGIAGPGGGTADKPVGTVWVALAGPDGRCRATRYCFPGSRVRVRERTARTALDMLRRELADCGQG